MYILLYSSLKTAIGSPPAVLIQTVPSGPVYIGGPFFFGFVSHIANASPEKPINSCLRENFPIPATLYRMFDPGRYRDFRSPNPQQSDPGTSPGTPR
eukprot:CAMPEP_0167740616 /NCGR_PEP_ID=MMETSP0110_2-20121227/380_1 /TAXON_ID=629695 /ORGANISM="Gymnochlora sp., Strain CCMP2014" /LENGTH=96 /DNA_ID=CAMNT_0007624537 /DNA_START=419 /DNA_END=705 /DNA_ORIENTATION=+